MNKAGKQQQGIMIVGGVVVVAVAVFVAVILFSQNVIAERSEIDYSQLQPRRTNDGAFIIGNPDAPITVVEVADFLCIHCQNYKSTVDQFINEFVVTGQAQFEFRLFAGQWADSVIYAQLAECSATVSDDPSTFWVAHEELFHYASSRRLNGDQAGRELARALNLNFTRLLECTQTARQYQTDMALARSSGATGTPAIRVRLASAPNTLPQSIGPAYASGGVNIEVLRTTVQNANR